MFNFPQMSVEPQLNWKQTMIMCMCIPNVYAKQVGHRIEHNISSTVTFPCLSSNRRKQHFFFQFCECQKRMFVNWSTSTQLWVARHSLGCMQAAPGSRRVWMERLAVDWREVVEGMLAVRGSTPPGCKASAAGEGRPGWWLPDKVVVVLGYMAVLYKAM